MTTSTPGALSVRESFALPYFYGRFGPTGSGPGTNLVYAARLTGDLDVERLRSAFQAHAADTPALRGYFSGPDAPPARLTAEAAPSFRLVDCTGDGRRFKAEVRTAAQRPYDLSAFPLLEVTVVRRSPRAHVLVVSAHHLLMDGWSILMLLRALSNRYRGRRARPVVAHDTAAAAAARLAFLGSDEAETLKQAAAHWLEPAREALFPIRRVLFPMPDEAHRMIRLEREPALAASRALGLSATGLHRLLMLLLQREITGLRQVAFSEAHANRPAEAPELYGFMSDDLIARAEISADEPVSAFAARVDAALATARSHALLPGARILRALEPDCNPLPRFHFNPLSVGVNALRLPGVRVSPFKIMPAYSVAEVVFVSGDLERVFVALAHGDIDGRDLDWVGDTLNALLRGLADPQRPIGELVDSPVAA